MNVTCRSLALLLVAQSVLECDSLDVLAGPNQLPRVAPSDAGMDGERLAQIETQIQNALTEKRMPGCVVMVGRHGKVVYERAFGLRQIEPQSLPMTMDTVFDMASITKPVATATSIMILVEQGKLRIKDTVAQHIPEFAQSGKERVTVLDLLVHQGGFIPDNALEDYKHGAEESFRRIYALRPTAEPGTRFIYSDVGFVVLAELIRKLSGQNVHEFSRQHIFAPLEMNETGYLPRADLRERAAPTEKRNGDWIRGEVHDPRAFELSGVAGHAGLFSTADDLSQYAQMMLNGGELNGHRVLSRRGVEIMTRGYPVSSGVRGLGWDQETGYSLNKGELFSKRAFGHGGFTGTVLWIDPELDLFFIFLSNRVHPNGKGLVNPLAGRIGSIIASSIVDLPPSADRDKEPAAVARSGNPPRGTRTAEVLTGIDVLERDGFRQLEEHRIGLITNHTGLSRTGVSTTKLLYECKSAQLVALFSPEHGAAGKLDTAKIADSRDPETNLPIYSLYGATREPTEEMLAGIDTLVFDIQDIGTRFYTYISTMGLAMKAAAKYKVGFAVLDRPNPINGIDVEGPIQDQGKESFVAFHPIALRHGMTVGELAGMMREELNLKESLKLEVIRCEGWRRSDSYDSTGLRWTNPSPNMRSLTQALLYPGIGLLETTNLSVGRGTDTPFEVLGAPWLDGRKLSAELNRAEIPGVRFVPIQFTPSSSKFQNQICGGINIMITDRQVFRPVRTGFEIAVQLRRLFPNDWEPKSYITLLGNSAVFDKLVGGSSAAQLESASQAGLRSFLDRRSKYLLYE